jgi:hypothetical protein
MKREPLPTEWKDALPKRPLSSGEHPPRTLGIRRILAFLLWLGLGALPFALAVTIIQTDPIRSEIVSIAITFLVVTLPYGVVGTVMAPRVSMRKRDVFLSRESWMWRVSYLPYCDWTPRRGDLDHLERVVIDDPGRVASHVRFRR